MKVVRDRTVQYSGAHDVIITPLEISETLECCVTFILTHISFIMSSPTVINKTNTISVHGDVIFFEVDGVLPNWKTYTFKVSFDGLGTKVCLLCFVYI